MRNKTFLNIFDIGYALTKVFYYYYIFFYIKKKKKKNQTNKYIAYLELV